MEIGSFIELQFTKGKEYFKGDKDIARLNSGRAAIYHAFRITGCNCIWLPIYQCETVKNFLIKNNVAIKYYHIDSHFNPLDLKQQNNEAVLIVNYFGVMSNTRMANLAKEFDHVIIDNSQAFYCQPVKDCLNVYSCRKFFGVPDGAYVVGKNAHLLLDEYEQGYSSDTSLFLLQRVEYGCEGKAYSSRSLNERRIDEEGVKLMSKLTRTILDSIDYEGSKKRRLLNYKCLQNRLDGINGLPIEYLDFSCVPMVYPFLSEDQSIFDRLLENKHFQGRWWNYILDNTTEKDFEYVLSKCLIPLTIDQRYGNKEMEQLLRLACKKSL